MGRRSASRRRSQRIRNGRRASGTARTRSIQTTRLKAERRRVQVNARFHGQPPPDEPFDAYEMPAFDGESVTFGASGLADVVERFDVFVQLLVQRWRLVGGGDDFDVGGAVGLLGCLKCIVELAARA